MDFLLDLLEDMQAFLENGGFVMWPLVFVTIALWFALAYRSTLLRRGSRKELHQLIRVHRNDAEKIAGKSKSGNKTGFIDAAVRIGWSIRRAHNRKIATYLDDELFELSEGMRKYRSLVRTLVTVAPLAGLLGTVSGMIEMFDSLASQTFHSQSGGITGGISKALFTTQFGLVIAVPGLIFGRFLDRREDAMHEEIEQIKEFFVAMDPEDPDEQPGGDE